MYAASAVFFPWAFAMGGHFHWLPIWQGQARIASADGDYLLWVSVWPGKSGSKMYLSTAVHGDASLCTPRGERLNWRLRGGMVRHLPRDITGQSISFSVYNRRPYRLMMGKPQIPALALKGVWGKRGIRGTVVNVRDDPENPKLKGLAVGTPAVFEEAGLSLLPPPCPKK
jgi:hypothetical protein